MSLVNQFEITLKDFLPEPPIRTISDRAGPVAIVSDRLFAKLNDYAADNQLRLSAVVQQLRDEIHRQPAAMKFAKGNRQAVR
jgi:hypothetical protein